VGQYADRNLTCRDCGKQFTFTAGEQEFFATRGFSEPSRCPDCRAARKSGGDYSRGGGRSYGGESRASYGGGYGGSSQGQRQMFKTVCADCGAETEVPFEPRQGRPVYCRDCFQKRNPRR
jgi:CxxC-x17-CxxC domain-containing protein